LPSRFTIGSNALVRSLAAGTSDTFTVQFNPTVVGTVSGQISINNSDADEAPYNFAIKGQGGVQLSVHGLTFSEGKNGAVLVTTSGIITEVITVEYSLLNGTAENGDVSPITGIVQIIPGDAANGTGLGVIVLYAAEDLDEDDESFQIQLVRVVSGPGILGNSLADALIIDDDANYSIDIKVAAYIPKSKGQALVWDVAPGNPFDTVNYLREPWQPPTQNWWVGTDDLEQPGLEGSSRHSTIGQIDRAAIGSFELFDDFFTSQTGISHRVTVSGGIAIESTKESALGQNFSHEEERADGTNGKSAVIVRTGSAYAFAPIGYPKIDIDFAVALEKLENGETLLKFRGTVDAFPAYEVIVNGNVVASYIPNDPGPGFLNLGGAIDVDLAVDVHILPPDRR